MEDKILMFLLDYRNRLINSTKTKSKEEKQYEDNLDKVIKEIQRDWEF